MFQILVPDIILLPPVNELDILESIRYFTTVFIRNENDYSSLNSLLVKTVEICQQTISLRLVGLVLFTKNVEVIHKSLNLQFDYMSP